MKLWSITGSGSSDPKTENEEGKGDFEKESRIKNIRKEVGENKVKKIPGNDQNSTGNILGLELKVIGPWNKRALETRFKIK